MMCIMKGKLGWSRFPYVEKGKDSVDIEHLESTRKTIESVFASLFEMRSYRVESS